MAYQHNPELYLKWCVTYSLATYGGACGPAFYVGRLRMKLALSPLQPDYGPQIPHRRVVPSRRMAGVVSLGYVY